MSRPNVLFAHERRSVARAVQRVLSITGFDVEHVSNGQAARDRLAAQRFEALVVDVALPGIPGYELCAQAKAPGEAARAKVVVLVASVYRRTSYKRRPTRLYGADDYVEIHHLCDSLPEKLLSHLSLSLSPPSEEDQERAREALRVEGDARMDESGQDVLANLIVADMVLYNGDAIFAANSLADAARAIEGDLDIARQLYAQVEQAEGKSPDGGADAPDPIGRAFAELMVQMGRAKPGEILQPGRAP